MVIGTFNLLYIYITYFMYLLIVYLYFSLSILLMLFGRAIGYKGSSVLSCCVMFFATILSYIFFFEVALNQSICSISLWSWISFDLLKLNWCFFFDTLSVSMLLIISTVSLCAVAYSVEYMSDDPHIVRFLSYISLFVFFMIFLVTSSNLFQLFVGWEGVGICSYLLINFWFTRISANKSALLAVFINKIGDIFVLISFGIIFSVYKTCDFSILSGLIVYCSNVSESIIVFGYLLLLGAVAKSAQVGLHIWLPEAMEGPTPVSSLIHAATMVTAGIFLLVRFSFVLECNSKILVLCMLIGSFTAFFASSVGIFLYDIKKIIAYSTCSQLGYMLLSCGFSNYSYTMFHLISHAFFKALLFLTAGYIIHFCANEQDIRKIGGIIKIFPSGYIFFLIGSISLIGFPFMSGFVTKEAILDTSYSSKIFFFYDVSILCQFISCFSLFFSVLYSIRLIINVFFGQYNGFKYSVSYFHYSGYFILIPLFFLSIFSIIFGYIFHEAFIGEGSIFWYNSFLPNNRMHLVMYPSMQFDFSFFLNLFLETELYSVIPWFVRVDFFFDMSSCASNTLGVSDFFILTEDMITLQSIRYFSEYNINMNGFIFFSSLYFLIYCLVYGLFFSRLINIYKLRVSLFFSMVYFLFSKRYVIFNRIFFFICTFCLFFFKSFIFLVLERGFLERFTSYGISNWIKMCVFKYINLKTGIIYHYAGFFLFILFLWFLVLC